MVYCLKGAKSERREGHGGGMWAMELGRKHGSGGGVCAGALQVRVKTICGLISNDGLLSCLLSLTWCLLAERETSHR